MRVGLLTNNELPAREGIGWHVTELARGLAARGHDVVLLARGSGRDWEEGSVAGLRLLRYPFFGPPPLHHLVAYRSLSRWLRAGAAGIELLHVHLPLLPPLATGLPQVVTVHSPMLTDSAAITEPGVTSALLRLQARLLSRRMEQAWLRRADRVVAVSSGVADELARRYDLAGRRPMIVRNGVDASFFAPDPAVERQPVLVAIGRLAVRKGMGRLLDAFAQVTEPRLRLLIVGEGPLQFDLKRRAHVLGIADRVTFAGFLDQSEVRTALRRAAAFVNPADYESGPLTLLEAMACGTPVISTPTGLARELGEAPPIRIVDGDAKALAGAIQVLLAAPREAAAEAAAARRLVLQQFDWSRMVDAVETVYGVETRAAA